jgi:ribosomal protein L14E/L6E/L27E
MMEIKMDFKNLASKIIDEVSGIKSTEISKNVEENDILEGLDLDFEETESKNLSEASTISIFIWKCSP